MHLLCGVLETWIFYCWWHLKCNNDYGRFGEEDVVTTLQHDCQWPILLVFMSCVDCLTLYRGQLVQLVEYWAVMMYAAYIIKDTDSILFSLGLHSGGSQLPHQDIPNTYGKIYIVWNWGLSSTASTNLPVKANLWPYSSLHLTANLALALWLPEELWVRNTQKNHSLVPELKNHEVTNVYCVISTIYMSSRKKISDLSHWNVLMGMILVFMAP